MTERAEVIVVGGGVMGLSTAFHLAEAGVDVLLLERDELGSGSTCRAAGGVRAQFSDPANIELARRSLAAFERFGQRPGAEIDLRQHGYLFLLDDEVDVDAFEAGVRLQNELGVPSRMLTVDQALELSPLVVGDGLLAAAFSPTDGHCTPEAVVQGYARGARALGARIRRHCEVTGIEVADGAITGVRTTQGLVDTSTVVVTAGAWSAAVGEMAGVSLPVVPLRRQIIVTSEMPGMPADLPMTIDFGTTFYFHPEGPGLLVGMSDPDQQPGFRASVRQAAARQLLSCTRLRAGGSQHHYSENFFQSAWPRRVTRRIRYWARAIDSRVRSGTFDFLSVVGCTGRRTRADQRGSTGFRSTACG